MNSIAPVLHTFKTGSTFVGASVDGQNLVLGETRNEEHAQEGRFPQLLTVIPLQEAIALAKAILAATEQETEDQYIERMYQYHLDHYALVDDHLEHELEIEWLRTGC